MSLAINYSESQWISSEVALFGWRVMVPEKTTSTTGKELIQFFKAIKAITPPSSPSPSRASTDRDTSETDETSSSGSELTPEQMDKPQGHLALVLLDGCRIVDFPRGQEEILTGAQTKKSSIEIERQQEQQRIEETRRARLSNMWHPGNR